MERITKINPKFSGVISIEEMEKICKELDEIYPNSVGYPEIVYNHDQDIIIGITGDWHIQSKYVQYTKWWKDMIYGTKTPNLFFIHTGDSVDGFGKRSIGGGIYDQAMEIPRARKIVAHAIKRFAENNKLLATVDGCHDLWRKQIDGELYAQEIADAAGALWLGNEGIIKIKMDSGIEYKIHATHKYKNYSSNHILWGPKKQLQSKTNADIFFGGHRHTPGLEYYIYKNELKLFLRCGSYKRTDGWLSANSYPMSKPIMPCVILERDRKNFIGFWDVKDAVKYLKVKNKKEILN